MSTVLLDNPRQQLICVDAGGRENGKTVDRKTAHTSPGTKHLAVQILVFTPNDELVLHERPLKKVGGGVLDAPTTHVLKGETVEEAARRCLRNEYGITQKIPVTILGGYSYEKDYGDGSCENEYCLTAYVVYDRKIVPDRGHVGKVVNVQAKKVLEEIRSGSKNYTVWLAETVKVVAANEVSASLFS